MNARDLLAVLLMIAPSFTLIAASILTIVPVEQSALREDPPAQAAQAAAQHGVATQKRMRDPWAKAVPAEYSKAEPYAY